VRRCGAFLPGPPAAVPRKSTPTRLHGSTSIDQLGAFASNRPTVTAKPPFARRLQGVDFLPDLPTPSDDRAGAVMKSTHDEGELAWVNNSQTPSLFELRGSGAPHALPAFLTQRSECSERKEKLPCLTHHWM
jgi:hypothetical protein